jgi:hypothetical protein
LVCRYQNSTKMLRLLYLHPVLSSRKHNCKALSSLLSESICASRKALVTTVFPRPRLWINYFSRSGHQS